MGGRQGRYYSKVEAFESGGRSTAHSVRSLVVEKGTLLKYILYYINIIFLLRVPVL